MLNKYLFTFFITGLFIARVAAQQPVTITIGEGDSSVFISRHIYGQFAEHLGRSIYDGFYRDGKIRMDIVDALKKIKVPNLRWPGGCFADQYHWRDGVGPVAQRPPSINTTWGMVKENNSFGTHEFMQLCALINCEPYFAGNVGTGSPQEMKDWVEYLNLKEGTGLSALRETNGHAHPYNVSWWGVGNESWGCGGNMRPEYYADLYKQYAAFLPDYSGTKLKKIIGGANGDDYNWTEVMMKKIPVDQAYGLSLHYYTFPTGKWNPRGSATSFSESEYAHTLKSAQRIETIISTNEKIMDQYDPKKQLGLIVDEWGVWTDVEPGTPGYAMYQQNSLRDALMAANTLNIFNNHAARVRGANLAQTVNVIHSLILTKGDSMILTPTYYVFDLFTVHQDAKLLPVKFSSPLYLVGKDTVQSLSISASKDSIGVVHVSMVNLDANKIITVELPMQGKNVSGKILTSGKVTDINEFGKMAKVAVKAFTDLKQKGNQVIVNLPPKSIVVIQMK